MIPVDAPEGYEGLRCWDDGTREWKASYREVGATWWTVAGLCGHAYLLPAELDARATLAIERHIAAQASDQVSRNAGTAAAYERYLRAVGGAA
jgi:hypothetical protein